MDVIKLYQDFNIPHKTEGHKHCRPGWVNTPCPFCTGNPGYHLGYDLEENYFYCWRCGRHSIWETVQTLIGIKAFEVTPLLKQYGGSFVKIKKDRESKIGILPFALPSDVKPLSPQHKRYLEGRGFDVDKLERQWSLLSTGPMSMLGQTNYGNRILLPMYWNKQMVTFQTRAVNKENQKKYLACSKDYEVLHHKHILYGDQSKWRDVGLIVEGATDVWRMGPETCATLGIKFKMQQVAILAKRFPMAGVMFDGGEAQARVQAMKLISELRFRRCKAFFVDIGRPIDPGQLPEKEAKYITKQICYHNKIYSL